MKFSINQIFFLLILLFGSCSQRTNKTLYEVKNPTTNQRAVLTILSPELNVGERYYVYILVDNEPVKGNNYGIVFSANMFDTVLPKDTSKIKMKWLSGDTLKINYDKSLKIHHQVIKTRDNVVVYEEDNTSKN